jgi:hypothetical protein
MKGLQSKYVLLLLFVVSCHWAEAQRSAGVRCGVTLSNFSNPEELGLESARSKLDYTMGYMIELNVNTRGGAQETNMVFQTGMTFERRGMRSSGFDSDIGVEADTDVTMKYFSIPLVLKAGIGDQDIVSFVIGPEFSLLYLATNEKEFTIFDQVREESINKRELSGITTDFKSVDVSMTAGVVFDIPITKRLRVPIDLRLGKSLMDTRRNPSRLSDNASHFLYKFNTGIVLYY